jgi:hypothetical protein
MSVKYPVYSLVISMRGVLLATGIRVHDLRSLFAVQLLYKTRAFGKLGRRRFVLILQEDKAWEDAPQLVEAIPLTGAPSPDHSRMLEIFSTPDYNDDDGEAVGLDVVK